MFKLTNLDTHLIDRETQKVIGMINDIINTNKKYIYSLYEDKKISGNELIAKLNVLSNNNKILTEIIHKLLQYQIKHCEFYKSIFIFDNLNDLEKFDKILKIKSNIIL